MNDAYADLADEEADALVMAFHDGMLAPAQRDRVRALLGIPEWHQRFYVVDALRRWAGRAGAR